MASRLIADRDVAALSFNGVNTTITLATLVGGAAANTATSVCMQFKTRLSGDQTVASLQGTNTKIKVAISNKLLVVMNNAGTTLVASNLHVEPGKFYKTVYTYDGTSHKIYAWNVTTATSNSAADTGVLNYLRLGNISTNADFFFNGILSKFSYYARVLTASEIDGFLTNAQSVLAAPVLDYNLNEGRGATIYDSSPNANNAAAANPGWVNSRNSDTPAPITGRMFIGGNMLYNGDFSHTGPNPANAGTSLRWMDGTSGGSFSDTSFGFFFTRNNAASGGALFDKTVLFNGMNTLRLATGGTSGSVTVSATNLGADPATLIRCKPGRTYVVKAWIKTQNVAANGFSMKLTERSSITALAIKSATGNKVTGTTDWQQVSFTDTTWPQIKYLSLEMTLNSNGNDAVVWLADVRVYEDGLPYRFQKTPLSTAKHFGFNSAWDLASVNPSDPAITAVFDDMLELGMDSVRASFTWNYIKGSSGATYNFGVYDRFVNIAVSKGFAVLPILSGPGWTNGSTQAWHDYYQTISAHYAPLGVYHFEYYNEANITTQFTTDCSPQKFWNGLERMSEGIRDGNPNAKVVFSGLTKNTTEEQDSSQAWSPNLFLQAVYDLGAKGYFDIFNYHPYDWNDNVFSKIFEVLAANGDADMPVWITEYGLPTAGGGEPRAGNNNEQIEAILSAVKKVRKWANLERCMFYNYRDEPGSPSSVEGHFGFKYTDSTNKPVWNAVKNAIINGTQ